MTHIPSAPVPLDREPVEMLAREISLLVRDHYLRRPTARATAQEVLNALACVAGTIILGARECGDEEGAREFFELALNQQLDEEERGAVI